jgi:hypothetical protein
VLRRQHVPAAGAGGTVKPLDRVLVLGYPGAVFRAVVRRVYVIFKKYIAVKDKLPRYETIKRAEVHYDDGYINDLLTTELAVLEACDQCSRDITDHAPPGAPDGAYDITDHQFVRSRLAT